MGLNPDCTKGAVDGRVPGAVTASCGCGWVEAGHQSRSAAKRAQKAHRFPPVPPPSPALIARLNVLFLPPRGDV